MRLCIVVSRLEVSATRVSVYSINVRDFEPFFVKLASELFAAAHVQGCVPALTTP